MDWWKDPPHGYHTHLSFVRREVRSSAAYRWMAVLSRGNHGQVKHWRDRMRSMMKAELK